MNKKKVLLITIISFVCLVIIGIGGFLVFGSDNGNLISSLWQSSNQTPDNTSQSDNESDNDNSTKPTPTKKDFTFEIKENKVYRKSDKSTTDSKKHLIKDNNKTIQDVYANKLNGNYLLYSIYKEDILNVGGEKIGEKYDWFVYNINNQESTQLTGKQTQIDGQDAVVYAAEGWINSEEILLREGDFFQSLGFFSYNVKTDKLDYLGTNEEIHQPGAPCEVSENGCDGILFISDIYNQPSKVTIHVTATNGINVKIIGLMRLDILEDLQNLTKYTTQEVVIGNSQTSQNLILGGRDFVLADNEYNLVMSSLKLDDHTEDVFFLYTHASSGKTKVEAFKYDTKEANAVKLEFKTADKTKDYILMDAKDNTVTALMENGKNVGIKTSTYSQVEGGMLETHWEYDGSQFVESTGN